MRDLINRGIRRPLPALVLTVVLAALAAQPAAAQAPKDTVIVKLFRAGEPLPGVPVKLMSEPPGGGEVSHGEQPTGADGLARFTVPHRPNLFFKASVGWQGLRYQSPKLPYGADPTVGLELPLEVFDAKGATKADLSFGEGSHLIVEFTEQALDVTAMLTVHNHARTTYAPEGGFVLPLPPGARNVRGIGGDAVTARAEGAAFLDPFLPGNTQIRVRYEIPYSSDSLELRHDLGHPAPGLLLFVDDAQGLQVSGNRILAADTFENQGRRWRRMQLEATDGKVEANLSGLPYRSSTGKWLAGFLSGALLLVGLVFGATGGRDARASVRRAAETERAEALAELEDIERDLAEGRIDCDTYDEDRSGALKRLAVALRTLES